MNWIAPNPRLTNATWNEDRVKYGAAKTVPILKREGTAKYPPSVRLRRTGAEYAKGDSFSCLGYFAVKKVFLGEDLGLDLSVDFVAALWCDAPIMIEPQKELEEHVLVCVAKPTTEGMNMQGSTPRPV